MQNFFSWILIATACFWGAQSGATHIEAKIDARQAWAQSLSNEDLGIFFYAVGANNSTLVIQLTPPESDASGCDSVMATLLVRQDFLRTAYYGYGMREVRCETMNEDGVMTGRIARDIVPPDPAPPAAPLPHTVPMRHEARVTDAKA